MNIENFTAGEAIREYFDKIENSLSRFQLQLLIFLQNPAERAPEGVFNGLDIFSADFPGMPPYIMEDAINDLNRIGLISFNTSIFTVMANDSALVRITDSITPLGKAFISQKDLSRRFGPTDFSKGITR